MTGDRYSNIIVLKDSGDVAKERIMSRIEQSNSHLETVWKFARGDIEPTEFEQWAYSESALESQLGESLYLETISVDYSNEKAVYEIRKSLEAYAREASGNLPCECITLPDLADVDMGEDSEVVLRTFEQRSVHGPPLWWLGVYQCSACEQWWLFAQESRINDVYFLKRLSPKEGEQVLNEKSWPDDFDQFETLLRLGRERGHRVDYVDPMNSPSLSWTAADLARERPGIKVSELAELLNLDLIWAEQIARKARSEEGAVIDFEGKKSVVRDLRLWIAYLFHRPARRIAKRFFRKATEASSKGEYKNAEGYLREALKLTTDWEDRDGLQENIKNELGSVRHRFAVQGNPSAQFLLGVMFDHVEAKKWFQRAAEQGLAEAQTNLGVMFFTGRGGPQDYEEAVRWWLKAAAQGEDQAQGALGNMYRNGLGVTQDHVEALNWYRLAAEQGNAEAQFYLGKIYNLGQGVEKDHALAVKWYRKAAEQGHVEAQANLGAMGSVSADRGS